MRLPWLRPDTPVDAFPPTTMALSEPNGLLCAGGDLTPARLLAAYARGIFPWFSAGDPILWWTPTPRCVLPLQNHRPSRRLQRFVRAAGWRISADTAFDQVMQGCAAPRPDQDGTWITADMQQAYAALHALGHAHSVEVWDGRELIGGMYGFALGRVFFGESMYSRRSNASKAALHALAHRLEVWGGNLLDGQVESAHLLSLGFQLWPRERFEAHLREAVTVQSLPVGAWTAAWDRPLCGQTEHDSA